MINTILGFVIVVAIMGLLILGIVKLIREPKGHGFASLTAFHDFQAKDKQQAIESVIEHQAEKKTEEQKSGKNTK